MGFVERNLSHPVAGAAPVDLTMNTPSATAMGSPLSQVLSGYDYFRDARINQVVSDYLRFVADLCPAFSLAEWLAVADVLLPSWEADDVILGHGWADIDDAEGLGERWNIDQAALVARFRGFSQAELLALREVLRRYHDQLEESHSTFEALNRAGARVDSTG